MSGERISSFVHPVVQQQIAAPQPKFLPWVSAAAVMSWLATSIDGFLGVIIASYVALVKAHPIFYRIAFFSAQLLTAVAVALYLSRKYREALWVPNVSLAEKKVGIFLILLPALSFYTYRLIVAYTAMQRMGELHGKRGIIALFEAVWSDLPSGSSWSGIIPYSILGVIVPLVETVLFSGLLANMVAKRAGALTAVVVVAFISVAWHIPAFGMTDQSILLFFTVVTYTTARFYSGSLKTAVIAHVAVNVLIFLPKWILAVVVSMVSGG